MGNEINQSHKINPTPDIRACESVSSDNLSSLVKQSQTKLNRYLMGNATKVFSVEGKQARGIYHVFENDVTHLGNGGATTSEAQVLFFNQMVLNAALTKNNAGMLEAYHYLRYFMMPHDGWGSQQLPDQRFLSKDMRIRGLSHWLVQVEGTLKNGQPVSGTQIFPQDNTVYEIYDAHSNRQKTPAIALNAKGLPDFKAMLPDKTNNYKFGSALDADQWIMDGFVLSGFFGLKDFSEDIRRSKSSLISALSASGEYPCVMKFGRYWGGNTNVAGDAQWVTDSEQLYSGYQDPAVWYATNEKLVCNKIMDFLEKSQNEYQVRYGISGPFMPLYDPKTKQFTWQGDDSNTHWMGFQYRTFAKLSMYYLMSKDSRAKVMLDKFIGFISKNQQGAGDKLLLPFWLNSGLKDGAGVLHQTGPVGSLEKNEFSADGYGLYAQGLALLYAATSNNFYQCSLNQVMTALLSHQSADGSYVQVDQNGGKTVERRYGFHQSEEGIAMSYYLLANQMRGLENHVKQVLHSKYPQMLTQLPVGKIESVFQKPSIKAVALIGNAKFYLQSDRIYSYGGMQSQVNKAQLQLSWQTKPENQGVVHSYDGGDWNGKPIDLKPYSKLFIRVQVSSGNAESLSLKINGRPVIAKLQKGLNFLDMRALKLGTDPLEQIEKVEIQAGPNSSGKVVVEILTE